MIFVLFISLCIAWYFYQYFEIKRTDQLKERLEKRRTSFEQLLKALKEKDKDKIINQNTQTTE